MSLGLSSLLVASTLVLHPLSTTTLARAAEPVADPSWDEPEDPVTDPAATPTEADPAEAAMPEPEPTPPIQPAPLLATRPTPPKGLGLMIAASVTGGLAWVTVFARLAAIDRCKTAAGQAVLGNESGFQAASACFRSAGSLVSLTPLGWLLNDATYGLAPAAGVFRGRYDGVNAAWDGKPMRNTKVLIGVGAGLLGVGVVGRIATMVAFLRQFNVDRLFQRYPLSAHFVLAQLSAASIAGGAGMLGYGLAYEKQFTTEDTRRKAAGLANVRIAPQLGWSYSGISVTGRF